MTPDVELANWFLQRPLRSHARSYSSLWGKSRYLNEIVAMMTAEDCRRRAAESLHTAEAATDPKTSAGLRRLSDAWATLAGQIEKDFHTERQWNAAGNQSHQKWDLAKLIPTPHKSQISCVIACNSAILMGQSPNPFKDLFF